MGMSDSRAAAFYAMTNSVPFEAARWLDAAAMRHWVEARPALEGKPGEAPGEQPQLANLDLSPTLR